MAGRTCQLPDRRAGARAQKGRRRRAPLPATPQKGSHNGGVKLYPMNKTNNKIRRFTKNPRVFLYACALALAAGCATPKDIVYLQDAADAATITHIHAQPIRLKPMDQSSIIVNTREPEITAMFNLPYYTRRIGEQQSLTGGGGNIAASTSATNISGYTVDSDGCIDFPVLGRIRIAGKTRAEVCEFIKQEIEASGQAKDPVVTVEFMNLGFSVLGEVTRPGRYRIDRDQFTIFDAISLAGDLTINGERQSVTLVRHGVQGDEIHKLDFTSAERLYNSPAYYIQQDDTIYVIPNDKRRRESTINGNNVRSSSFWISLASLATSVALLIFRIK